MATAYRGDYHYHYHPAPYNACGETSPVLQMRYRLYARNSAEPIWGASAIDLPLLPQTGTLQLMIWLPVFAPAKDTEFW